jgi:hypothetical protein
LKSLSHALGDLDGQLDLSLRPEQLAVSDFVAIANHINQTMSDT